MFRVGDICCVRFIVGSLANALLKSAARYLRQRFVREHVVMRARFLARGRALWGQHHRAILIHDGDSKLCASFCKLVRSVGLICRSLRVRCFSQATPQYRREGLKRGKRPKWAIIAWPRHLSE